MDQVNVSDAVMAFGCGPVLRLAHAVGIIDGVPGDIPTSGNIEFAYGEGSDEKKYTAQLDVVAKDYMLDISQFGDDVKLTHLLSVLFNSAIAAHRSLSVQNVIPNTATLYVDMDTTTLHFGEDNTHRIGLRIAEANNIDARSG